MTLEQMILVLEEENAGLREEVRRLQEQRGQLLEENIQLSEVIDSMIDREVAK